MFKILKTKFHLNQNGFSIITVMIALGIISVAFMAVNGGLVSVLKVQSNLTTENSIASTRARIIASLSNAITLRQVMQLSSGMGCLTNRTDCSSRKSVATPVTVVTPEGVKLTDADDPTYGFTRDGNPCTGFDQTNGNEQCPFSFEVTWMPICPVSGGCSNPQNRFRGTLKAKTVNSDTNFVHLKKFNFFIIPANFDNSMEANCQALNGTFNATNGSCLLPLEGMCPAGQVVTNIDVATNIKYCNYLLRGACPPGYKISNVATNGALQCVLIEFCPTKTKFGSWDPWLADNSGDGGDGGDGCDGLDGCDGGS